ncbi:hypothetical protein LIER_25805 [Lithospermum erythrorhizon]|uniref:Uncharacterized protein n=1 Tax=Lithospermum erythrorhizon TaxID=34254 RepID=A0AAV3R674_LITER
MRLATANGLTASTVNNTKGVVAGRISARLILSLSIDISLRICPSSAPRISFSSLSEDSDLPVILGGLSGDSDLPLLKQVGEASLILDSRTTLPTEAMRGVKYSIFPPLASFFLCSLWRREKGHGSSSPGSVGISFLPLLSSRMDDDMVGASPLSRGRRSFNYSTTLSTIFPMSPCINPTIFFGCKLPTSNGVLPDPIWTAF